MMDTIPKDESNETDSKELSELQRLESIDGTESTDHSVEKDVATPPSSEPDTAPVSTEQPHSSLASSYILGNKPHHDDADSHAAKRFLIAYVSSVFSAISLLFSASFLVYVLLDHFITAKKDDAASLFYFDLAPVYISIMASIIVFSVLYIISTYYVAKSAANDTIGLRDWRVYKTIYSFFSASLLIIAASVIASLLYIPLAQTMIASDLTTSQISIQVLGGINVLVWIGLLIWQERLVKNGKHTKMQGVIVVVLALVVVVLTGIFPVGSKSDTRYDHRIESDLSTIQSEIETYKSDNNGALPTTLTNFKFTDNEMVKNRLANYKYSITKKTQPAITDVQKKALVSMQAAVLAATEKSNADDTTTSDTSTDTSDISSLFGSAESESAASQVTYKICATFKTDTTKNKDGTASPLSSLSTALSLSSYSFASHKSGEVCFDRS